MNIRRKLILTVSLMLLFMGMISVVGIRNITMISESENRVLEESTEIDAIQELRLLFQQVLMPANDYLIHGDKDELIIFNESLKKTKEQLLLCKKLVGGTREKKSLVRFEESLQEVESLGLRIFDLDNPVGNIEGSVLMEEMDGIADRAITEIDDSFEEARIEMKEYTMKANEAKTRAMTVTIVIGLIALVGALIGAFFLARRITEPIKKLVQLTRKVSSGDLTSKAEVTSDDEIGELTASFNKMTGDLLNTTVSKNYVDNIIKSMIDTLIVITPEGKIQTVNQAILDLLEYKEEELIGSPVITIFAEKASEEFIFKKLSSGYSVTNYEIYYKTKRKNKIPMLLSGTAMRDEEGNLRGIVCIAKDITERKRAEEEKEKLIFELKNALTEVKTLSGLLPICANCKKIRDDKGYWHQVEIYIRDHSTVEFSHGLCPECFKKLYPDYQDKLLNEEN